MAEELTFEIHGKSGEWKDVEIPDGFIAILQSATFCLARTEAVGRKTTLTVRTTFDCASADSFDSNKVTEVIPVCSVYLTDKPKVETIYCVYSKDLKPSVHVDGPARVKITGVFVPDAFGDAANESDSSDSMTCLSA
jgi:hypothetical protein